MRIGLIGPAEGADEGVLREATEFLLGDAAVDQAIYLGEDGAAEAMATRWAEELAGEDGRDFLSRAAELAVSGSAPEIDAPSDAIERPLGALPARAPKVATAEMKAPPRSPGGGSKLALALAIGLAAVAAGAAYVLLAG